MNDAGEPLAMQDDAARALALDVTRSCLVQAPAGSGKTELLIQRFLALLAHVERPERIVAMTFTRKASAEMRQRIFAALQEANDPESPMPRDAHSVLTRQLAHAALEQDRRLAWGLLDQPARLRVVTIDALAAGIARQAPLAAGLGALPAFVDDARALHLEAARATLAAAASTAPHWQTFLQWLDNDAGSATELIAQMLAARDRWPAGILADQPQVLRVEAERVLEHEARETLRIVRERMPASLTDALPAFAQMAAEYFAADATAPPFASAVRDLAQARALPGGDARDAWCALADWLLTREGAFTRGVNVRQGFPRRGSGAGASARAERKAEFKRWLNDAAGVPGLAAAWHRVRVMPPAHFGDDAWAFVAAAMNILPRAVDALTRVFAARGQADFAEATLRALNALGASGDPTDLLLAIDYRLSHLLVDEFQDTSLAQVTLIGRLTEGWEPRDGRTLFAVGDPMQSIYRFRQADVRIFIRAQAERRIAGVPVGVVELARNFRSQREIVAWVNDVFGAVLPPVSDAARGEAGYRKAYADSGMTADLAPTLDLQPTREAEAASVVARILEARAAGAASIALLVRARSHAQALLPALRRAGIDYSAVDLEGLYDRLATRDLLSLARALAQPADRLAWLAVLHAPWCGIGLADLLIIAQASRDRPILDAITDLEVALRLPADTRARLARAWAAIEPALAGRGGTGFSLRVRAAWLALGGPACAGSPLDRSGADRLFSLLAQHERGGDLPDHEAFSAMASRLFAEAGDPQPGVVQVMTLHRAKGLQFDAVIIPGLDLGTGGREQPLLRWKVLEREGVAALVLAPMRARIGARAEADPVYQWLGTLDAGEEVAELGRLLYVGATRAKRRLHLVAVAQCETQTRAGQSSRCWKRPRRGTPLERLWDALGIRLPPPIDAHGGVEVDAAASAADARLFRLPVNWRLPSLPARLPVTPLAARGIDAPVFDWADAIAAAVGTVAHRLLAQIGSEGLDAWDERRLHGEWPRILAELGSEGVDADLRERTAQRVATVVARTLSDARGRWLFDAAHADARSEWALAGEDEGRIVHVVLDRSFVAGGTRYIVDFKTGAHLGGDPTTFLQQEFERYRPQLARYARVVRTLDPRPVRIALYHPLVEGGWQEEEMR